MNKRIYIDTLGCAKNEYDSQVLAAALLEKGCVLCDSAYDADILIVNTCGFIESAKVESIEHIFEMATLKGEDKKLVVTGCLAQRYHEELAKEMPEVDIFAGVNDYEALAETLVGEDARRDMVTDDEEKVLPYRERFLGDDPYTGFLKIAEGCNKTCTFCAIPSIRGRYRSKKIEDIVAEAGMMAENGVKELILIAQDTSYYGIDLYGRPMLPELLKEVCSVDGIKWIRLMYVYDDGITDELIETIAEQPKICKYIDMPIQHVSDNVLRRMGRRSTKASIEETIRKLRARIPDVHIRTTILVGFPGETEEDFEELMDFLAETRIERVGAFAFSDEEGTAAHRMDGKIPQEIAEQRRDRLMEQQMYISESINATKTGKVYEVIVDEVQDDGVYIGRTRFDAPEIDNEVAFTGTDLEPGDIVNVLIEEAYEYDLAGEEITDELITVPFKEE